MRGIFGSDRYMELFDEERADARPRSCGSTRCALRRLVPLRAKQRLYDLMLRRYRPEEDPRAEAITHDDFCPPRRAASRAASTSARSAARPRAIGRPLVASLTGAMPAAEAAVQPSCSPAPPTVCAWCGAPLGPEAERLARPDPLPACGAATTDPWPDDEELARAYGTWYRPESGRRFALLGDALLSRTRAAMAGRIDEIAPDGPILDVGAGEGVLIDALRARGREVMGLERDPRHPDIVDRSIHEVEGEWAAVVFWHSLEHLPRPRRRDPRGLAPADAGRRGRGRGARTPDSLQAKAFGDEWLHLDLPRHLVHLSARAR